jgi:hypothetical protein
VEKQNQVSIMDSQKNIHHEPDLWNIRTRYPKQGVESLLIQGYQVLRAHPKETIRSSEDSFPVLLNPKFQKHIQHFKTKSLDSFPSSIPISATSWTQNTVFFIKKYGFKCIHLINHLR